MFRDDTVFGRRQSTTSIDSMDGIANSLSTATSKQLVTALMGVSVGEERDDAPSISTVSDIGFNQSDDESDVFDDTLPGRPQSRSTYLPNGGRKSPFEADEKRPGFTIGGELDRFGSNGSIKLNNPVKELSCNSQLDDGHDHVPLYATYQAPSLVGEHVKKDFVRKTLNNMLNTFKTCKTCVSDRRVHELTPSCSIDDMVSRFNVYFAADGKCEIAMHIRISRIKSQPQPQQTLSDERNVVGYLSTMNTNMSLEERIQL